MTRLDGEKKSPLPWIIGLLVLALLAAAIYYFAVAKGKDAGVSDANGIGMISNAPGGMSTDNSVELNAVDTNVMDANALDMNSADANMIDSNSAMIGGADANMADANAMGSSGTMMDNSAMPAPAMTPASTDSKSADDGVVATRSKTIKTDDKTVTYKKSVTANGEVMRDKKIVAEPVQKAKQ